MIYRIDKITSGRPHCRLYLSSFLMDNILFKSKYQERKRDGRAAMAGKIRFQNPAHHVNPVYSFPLRWASDMIYRIDKITSGRPCPRLHLSNVLMDNILFKSEYQERKRDGRAAMAGKIRFQNPVNPVHSASPLRRPGPPAGGGSREWRSRRAGPRTALLRTGGCR